MNSVDRNSVRIGRHQAARSTVPKPVCVSTDEGSCVWKLNQRRRPTSLPLILLGISWPVISPDLPAGLQNSLISLSLSSPLNLSLIFSLWPHHMLSHSSFFITFSISLCLSHHLSSPLSPSLWGPEPSESSQLLFTPNSPGFFTLSLHVTTLIFTHLKNLLQEIPCALCQIRAAYSWEFRWRDLL